MRNACVAPSLRHRSAYLARRRLSPVSTQSAIRTSARLERCKRGAIVAWEEGRNFATTGYDVYAEFVCDSAGTYCRDADADGYGSPAVSIRLCVGPGRVRGEQHRLRRPQAAIHPGATEDATVSTTTATRADRREGARGEVS